MNLLLIFNPHAAAGRAEQLLEPVRTGLERFASVRLHRTTGPGDAIDRIATQNLSGFDGVVAAGGDGTLFEVLNGLYARPPGERPPLGVVPVGTGNAFARDLGLAPGDWEKGVDIIARGRMRRFDVGRVAFPAGVFHFKVELTEAEHQVLAARPLRVPNASEVMRLTDAGSEWMAHLYQTGSIETAPTLEVLGTEDLAE